MYLSNCRILSQSLADADASSYTPPQEQLPSALPALPPPPVDGAAPAQIAAVYTAADFQRAFHAGVRDIELRAHMDMRPLSDVASTVLGVTRNDRLGGVKPTTRSIRVRLAAHSYDAATSSQRFLPGSFNTSCRTLATGSL